MKIRKIIKTLLLLFGFAIIISGYTQSIEKNYSLIFDTGEKSELKITQIKGKDYVSLDDVFEVFFRNSDYDRKKQLIGLSDCQLIFAPNYFIGLKEKKVIRSFQMNESAIVYSSKLFIPAGALLNAFESFKIFNITKVKNTLNVKKLRETSVSSFDKNEDVTKDLEPNVYLLPPKLNRQGLMSSEINKGQLQLTDNSRNQIALQTKNQSLKGLWFTKVFAEQKNDYIDLHFIANSIIDMYHRPECDGKTVIIRIPGANNSITDFSKVESVYPITNIAPSKVRNFQIYTLTLSDNLIKCTSRRNGDKEIIFSFYPAHPKKSETDKVAKEEKKVEQVKEKVEELSKEEKPEKKDESKKIEKPVKQAETEIITKPEEPVKTIPEKKPEKIDEIKKPEDAPKLPTSTPQIEKEKKKWELDVIVLDPGHGGNDAGAVGLSGVYEKNITLKLALKVRDLLKVLMPQTKVVMTREDDTFIELYRRGQIANKAEGKLFISIHLNSANKKPSPANGIETYILRPGRNDDAIRVANFENSVIKFEKQTEKYKKLTDEEIIIATMAQSAFVKFSELFARLMQEEVCKTTKLEDRGVKQAGFYVLIGASMPNVLFEASFLSNEGDERFANSEAGQNKIAKGIVNAIIRYAEEYGKY